MCVVMGRFAALLRCHCRPQSAEVHGTGSRTGTERRASVRQTGAHAMNSGRHIFLIATAVLLQTFWFAPSSLAQSSEVDELSQRVNELDRAENTRRRFR